MNSFENKLQQKQFSRAFVLHLCDVPFNILTVPVIPQTGLPGGGAGTKASKVPGYVHGQVVFR